MRNIIRLAAALLMLAPIGVLAQTTPGGSLGITPNGAVAGSPVTFSCYLNNVPSGTATFSIAGYVYSAPVVNGLATVTASLYPGTSTSQCTGPNSGGYANVSFTATATASANNAASAIIANQIEDAQGGGLVKGTICFTPVDGIGNPAPFTFGGGGNARPVAVCRNVVNGAITSPLFLGRSDKTMPVGINYRLVVTDASTGQQMTLGSAAVTGDTWSLGNWAPSNVQTAPLAAWIQGPQGPAGPAGGPAGPVGPTGATPQLSIGSVTPIAAGAAPSVTIGGSTANPVINLSLPVGRDGVTPQFGVGSITTGAAGSAASVSITGTASNPILNVVIPAGPAGVAGAQGPQGPVGPQGPAGSGGSTPAGIPQSVQIAGTSGLAADNAVHVGSDHSIITAGPKVNIRDSMFALGWTLGSVTQPSCAGVAGNSTGYADPTGQQDSTCAIQSARNYIIQSGIQHSGTGYMVLYIPHGTYLINSATYTSPIQMDFPISIEGDAANASILHNTSPHATAIFYTGLYTDSNTGSGQNPVGVRHIRVIGQGHLTNASGIEILNETNTYVDHDVISNVGGISLNYQGSSERNKAEDVDINSANVGFAAIGDTNEDFFERVNVLFSGADDSNYCYSRVNCPGGVVKSSGTWYPDPTPLVRLSGDNISWVDSSIKGLLYLSGIKWSGATGYIRNTYLEGFPVLPGLNHAIQALGAVEIGHLTAAVGTSDLAMPIDDALQQPTYIGDPAFATAQGVNFHAGDGSYKIGPADFLWGSTAQSTAMPSITRDTYELVTAYASSADNRIHLANRAQGGTSAIAWAQGSIIAQIPSSTYGTLYLQSNHINTDDANSISGITRGCNDTARLPYSTPGGIYEDCADIIAGADPDGFTVNYPSASSYVGIGSSVSLSGNGIYFGQNDEVGGEGYIKVPGSAGVSFAPGDNGIPQVNGGKYPYNPAQLAAGNYALGESNVQFVQWPGAMALGTVYDPGAGVTYNPAARQFNGLYTNFQGGGGTSPDYELATLTLNGGTECRYSYPVGVTVDPTTYQPVSGQPGSRTCDFQGGFAVDYLSGGNWLNSFYANSASVGAALPFTPNAGIQYPINGYTTSTAYVMPAGQQYTQWDPRAVATLTLPPMTTGNHFFVVVPSTTTQAITFRAISGLIQSATGGTFGSSWTPASAPGVYGFESDGANYQVLSPIGYTGTCVSPKAITYTNGVATSCQ